MNSNFDSDYGSCDSVTGDLITSFSGHNNDLRHGSYQKVNDMKGYLYTLSKIPSDTKIKDCYEKTLEYLTEKYDERVNEFTRSRYNEQDAKISAL